MIKKVALLFLALLPLGPCHRPAQAEERKLQVIGAPFGYLNNTDSAFAIKENQAQDLLNVDIAPNGKSVKKRKGYAVAYTLSNSTSPLHGMHSFYNTEQNQVSLFFNDTNAESSLNGATPAVLFSTGPNGATYQCVDSLGEAYCANTERSPVFLTDGETYELLTTHVSTPTMLTLTPSRLAMAGFDDAPSRVDFSAEADFTNTTPGGDPEDPINFTINSAGSRITHIIYAHGRTYVFKDASFVYIAEGSTHAGWRVEIVSPDIGTLHNTSVFRDQILYFQGQDGHWYAMDGTNLTKLSRDIQGTVGVTQGRASNSWTQTTQEDWEDGTILPSGRLSTAVSAGSILLSTMAAMSFTDTSEAEFSSGTLTNLDSSTIPGTLALSLGSASTFSFHDTSPHPLICGDTTYFLAQQFFGAGGLLSRVDLKLDKDGSPANPTLRVLSDSSDTPGSIIGSETINAADIPTTANTVTVTFDPLIRLIDGEKYWLQLVVANGQCATGNKVSWASVNESGFCEAIGGTINCGIGNTFYSFLYDRNFSSSGNIVSEPFDVGVTTTDWLWNWSTFSVNHSTPTGTTLTYETQTSSASDGTYTSLVSVSSGSAPTSTVQQFIRYKASFSTTDQSTSPVLNDVSLLTSSFRRPYATFYSQINEAPNLNSWDTFELTQSLNGGDIDYFIRASTNSFTITSSTPAWTEIEPGAIPTASTGTNVQIKSEFSITNATQNPTLNDFTVNWFEGSAADKTYATYHQDALWWSIASGAGATANNKIAKLDLINQGWTLYDFGSNGFIIKDQELFFGSSNDGKVFQFGTADDDNGTDIEAYWRSRSFFGDDPFVDKDLWSISLVAKARSGADLNVTYSVNGATSTTMTVPIYESDSTDIIKRNLNLPLGTVANTFDVQFGNDSGDSQWELFVGRVEYSDRPWMPEDGQ